MLEFQPRIEIDNIRKIDISQPFWYNSLLFARGIDSLQKAEDFLYPKISNLNDPFLMENMGKAVERIRKAIEKDERIIIYGDYDVDGICGTVLLLEGIRGLGGKIEYYIPNRHKEGYGLNEKAIKEISKKQNLMITVDCGITNNKEIELAKKLGMEVIVTDHHQLPEKEIEGSIVLNPLMGEYPFKKLCGAGVAAKLLHALAGEKAFLDVLDLVALATVADIVPLEDENRIMVFHGLKKLSERGRPGLKELMVVAGILEKEDIKAGQIAFIIGPRINATGRVSHGNKGVELLLSEREEAAVLARELEDLNQKRQKIENRMLDLALETIDKDQSLAWRRSVVIAEEDWNLGVVGLVASRIVEKVHYPTIILTNQKDYWVGSARSIPGINIYSILNECSEFLIRFGGHEQAAGLAIKKEHLEDFIQKFDRLIRENSEPKYFIPKRKYDLAIELKDIDKDMVRLLEKFQPTGYGNPEPVFLLEKVNRLSYERMGKEKEHLKLFLKQENVSIEGIGFRMGDMETTLTPEIQALVVPNINKFRGQERLQCIIKALKPIYRIWEKDVGDDKTEEKALVDDFKWLLKKGDKEPRKQKNISQNSLNDLDENRMEDIQGKLFVARTHAMGKKIFEKFGRELAIAKGKIEDSKNFNTLLLSPRLEFLKDMWEEIYLLDGQILPWEGEIIKKICPRAKIHIFSVSTSLKEKIESFAMEDDFLRKLYIQLKINPYISMDNIQKSTGLTLGQIYVGLESFAQMNLINWTEQPFEFQILPSGPCDIGKAPLLKAFRQLTKE